MPSRLATRPRDTRAGRLAAARRRVRGARAAGRELGAAVPRGPLGARGRERGRGGTPRGRTDRGAPGGATSIRSPSTPLISQALSLQQLGRNREALDVLRSAQSLQPDNFEVYYQEGLLQLKAFGRRQAALAAFGRALALNPLDRDTRREIEALLGG